MLSAYFYLDSDGIMRTVDESNRFELLLNYNSLAIGEYSIINYPIPYTHKYYVVTEGKRVVSFENQFVGISIDELKTMEYTDELILVFLDRSYMFKLLNHFEIIHITKKIDCKKDVPFKFFLNKLYNLTYKKTTSDGYIFETYSRINFR